MILNRKIKTFTFIMLASLASTLHCYATPTDKFLFILDASNSMWAQIQGRAKIDIAKNVLVDIVSELPAKASVGLAAYGHQSHHGKRDCTDIALLADYATIDQSKFMKIISSIQPKGQTPIAATLLESANWVQSNDSEQEKSTIVLITDGIESCEGDPCASAKHLAESGVDLALHVVGFDLTDEQQQAVKCISDIGGGQYVDARSASELQLALTQVTQSVEVEKTSDLYFEDDFVGEDLMSDWSVINGDDELYIVEDDELLLIGSTLQSFSNPDASNIFTLDKELPKGDWDINLDLKIKMQTGADMFEIGLFKDHENHLAVQYYLDLGDWCKRIAATFNKFSKGKPTSSTQLISANSGHCGSKVNPDTQRMIDTHINDGFRLTFSKRGREYSTLIVLNGISIEGQPLSFQSDILTSLRSPGNPAFLAGQFREVGGETLVHIDRFEIISISN
jgi:hypothetical protein